MAPTSRNTKCSIKGCPFQKEEATFACYAKGCSNVCHIACYKFLVAQKNNVDHFCNEAKIPNAAACTKRHFNVAKKKVLSESTPVKNRNVAWNKDGQDRPEGPCTSENSLLDWWTTSGNYSDFCNGAGGRTTLQVCSTLSEKFKAIGVIKYLSPQDILAKINSWERAFKIASDFASNAGEGIKQSDAEAAFNELVCKRFKHCFVLLNVMLERSNIKPAASSDAILASKSKSIDHIQLVKSGNEGEIEPDSIAIENQEFTLSENLNLTEILEDSVSPSELKNSVDTEQSKVKDKDEFKRGGESLTKKRATARKIDSSPPPVKKSFEEMFLELQQQQLRLEEAKCKAEAEKQSIDHRVNLMKKVCELQNNGFSTKEILGMFPEAKGMLNDK